MKNSGVEPKLWRDLITSITKSSYDYDETYMKYSSDDELPLNKTIELARMIIVIRAVHKNNKYYRQVFLLSWMSI